MSKHKSRFAKNMRQRKRRDCMHNDIDGGAGVVMAEEMVDENRYKECESMQQEDEQTASLDLGRLHLNYSIGMARERREKRECGEVTIGEKIVRPGSLTAWLDCEPDNRCDWNASELTFISAGPVELNNAAKCPLLCNYAVSGAVCAFEFDPNTNALHSTFFDRHEAAHLSRVARLKKIDDATVLALAAIGSRVDIVGFYNTAAGFASGVIDRSQIEGHITSLYRSLLMRSPLFHYLRFLVRRGISLHLYTKRCEVRIDACANVEWNAKLIELLLAPS